MSPNEFAMMLDQWARANAPDYDLIVDGVDVAILGLADHGKIDDNGERGGFFPFSVATLTVRRLPALFGTLGYADGSRTISQTRGRINEFERLFLQLCHDIWMAKDLAVRGRVMLIN